MSEQPITGFYGKFPELGDFVNRRIPRTFLEPWDEWMQGAISSSREQLGDQWLDVYLNGPIWCFILSGGLCGEQPWAGLFMPSVDRVGRYYPLTIATPLPLDVNPIQLATAGKEWFDRSTDVILTALDEQGFDMGDFDARVCALGDLAAVSKAGAISGQFGYGSAWRMPLDHDTHIGSVLPGLVHLMVMQRLGLYSLWWTAGSPLVEPSMLLTAAMPDAHDCSTMFAGNWTDSGWDECLKPAQELDVFHDETSGRSADL